MYRRFAATSALTLVLALAGSIAPLTGGSAAAEESGYAPRFGASFNVPRTDYPTAGRIERTVLDAVRNAKPGSYIRIAVYSFDRRNVADELIAAYRRGVNVQVVLNDHQFTTEMRRLKREIGARRDRESFMWVCDGGCRGDATNGVMHNKLFLFSQTGSAFNTVMTGSANFTGNGVNNQWNDTVVLPNRTRLHNEFVKIFEELAADRPVVKRFRAFDVGERFKVWITPLPSYTRAKDPIANILDAVQCRGARAPFGRNGRTVVRVSMHAWATHRGAFLANKVRDLYAQGCDVKVMYGMAGAIAKNALKQRTSRGVLPFRANGFDTDYDGEIDKYSHQKYLIISGKHYGEQGAWVYTGSSNWASSGLKGDEMILGINGPALFNQYLNNFDFIYNGYSRPGLHTRPVPMREVPAE